MNAANTYIHVGVYGDGSGYGYGNGSGYGDGSGSVNAHMCGRRRP
jgi:hypothetical protein